MDGYADKRIVVTGGTSGIGLAVAELLTAAGARVLVTGRDERALAAVGEDGRIRTLRSDAAALSDIDTLAERVADEFGALDALFVNAGLAPFVAFADTTEELYDRVLATNAKGPYFTVQKLAPLMAPGSGVVFTTSAAHGMGAPMLSAYAASKAALRSMARGLARELLPHGIRVNAIGPGPIDSGATEKTTPADQVEQTKAAMAAENPMGRMGTPAEAARAAVFLAFAATYTTGAELAVDGGASQL